MTACTGGKELQENVVQVVARLGALEGWKRAQGTAGQPKTVPSRGVDPWTPGYPPPGPAPSHDDAGIDPGLAAGVTLDFGRTTLGGITHKDRPLLDDKVAERSEFRFNGRTGGPRVEGDLRELRDLQGVDHEGDHEVG